MATSRSRAATLRARYSISPSQRESFRELVWRLDTAPGLVAMFSLAFLVRILIAPHFGFVIDLNFVRTWSRELHDVGPHRFYSTDHLADYPPGYLYVLWLVGSISATPGYLLLKLPAIVADLGLAWIAGTFSERLAPGSLKERIPVRAVVAGAVLFNPAVLALSAGWGQVDSVPVFFVLASLLLLFTGAHSLRRELAAVDLFRFYRHSAGVQPVTTANAFNFWGALAFWRNDASGAGVLRIAGVPAIYVGVLLFSAATAWLLRQVHRAIERGLDQTRVLIVGAAVESLLGY